MKLSRLALAAAAVAAAPAFAATGSLQTLYGVSAANTVFVSGASALSGSFANVVAANCSGGATNVKSLTINGSTSDGRITVCTSSSTGGSPFAGPFAVVKRDTNGSFDGVGPVISQTGLQKWADIANCDSTTLQCALDSTTVRVPHAGLTDVDTNVWVGMAATGALSIPVPTPTSTVLSGGFAGQGFGVMVSEALYNAMMAKQKTEGRLPAGCAAGDFTPGACQPSISKAEYAAVVDGGNFAFVANGALSGDAGVINLCRRVETSGTQASSNVVFLNNSCGNASPTRGFKSLKSVDLVNSPSAVAFSSSNGDAVTGNYDDFGGAFGLFEGSGTGDARNCVIRRNGGKNPNNVADAALGNYAIGWISLENAPAAGWKYLKLDGVSPNAYQVVVGSAADTAGGGAADGWAQDATQRVNVVKALYDAAPELEMLWPSSTPFGTFLSNLKNTFADPNAVNTRGIFQANGTFSHADFPAQVHRGTRDGNFCAPQALAE